MAIFNALLGYTFPDASLVSLASLNQTSQDIWYQITVPSVLVIIIMLARIKICIQNPNLVPDEQFGAVQFSYLQVHRITEYILSNRHYGATK